MAGKLYGVSVGPGDPGLLTLKAKELIDKSAVVAYPVHKRGEDSTALDIVKGATDLSGKKILELLFSMNPDDKVREACRSEAVKELTEALDSGMDVAMISLGDVGVYSTYMYVDEQVRNLGYETEVIPGITSFCGGAAEARIPLMIGDEDLTVIPMAKKDNGRLDLFLASSDNLVVMKAWDSMQVLADLMEKNGIPLKNATVISNIGMEGEYIGPIDVNRKYGYFTTVIVKKNRNEESK
ncbi:MAG: precorrin-2 C(20)-methyltransferase [Candidatus Methanomethylophilaceae archaeon]|jgi:precorrin-2/cobalt-factor-2 C20-methyltransferase